MHMFILLFYFMLLIILIINLITIPIYIKCIFYRYQMINKEEKISWEWGEWLVLGHRLAGDEVGRARKLSRT